MAQGQEEEDEWVSIVEEREEKMVTPSGKNPTLRIARFLKHSVTCTNQVFEIPSFAHNKPIKWSSEVHFKGWRYPQKKWKQWVDQMSPIYEPIWKKGNIYDSIIASTYELRKNRELVLGLTEFWCPETNTFVFPWGEATLTLEDMFILGGFSVIGEPITNPIAEDLSNIEEKLLKEHKKFWKHKVGKPCHSAWIKRFMDSNCELEHVAFISLWLSRYVLPTYPEETMSTQMFPIAIHLSQGTRVALAPTVLTSIYRDLRVLKQGNVASITTKDDSSSSTATEPQLSVWAPFQIMQIWAWEHLPTLRPKPNSLNHGEPRVARWHKISSKSEFKSVRSTMNSIKSFEFRPYSYVVGNWRRPLFYEERGGWVFDSPNVNYELQTYCRCIMACELVGLDCIEQYLPHRVGMQFGMDQDLPGHFVCANATWEVAWRTYDKPHRNIRFYLPPCLVEPNVTARYFEWWKQCGSARQDAVHNILENEHSSKSLEKSQDASDENELESQCSPPPGFPRKCWWELHSSSDDDNIPLSQSLKRIRDINAAKNRAARAHKRTSSTQVQSPPSSTTEKDIGVKKILTNQMETRVQVKVSGNSVNNSIDTQDYRGESNGDEIPLPGMELEARISKLEEVFDMLKKSFGSMFAAEMSNESPSHA